MRCGVITGTEKEAEQKTKGEGEHRRLVGRHVDRGCRARGPVVD